MATKTISRRAFLKTGCLTAAAAGMAVCGVGLATPTPDASPVDLPSLTFGDKIMCRKILVAYASGLGSTAEVAVEIGKTLNDNGFCVDVRPIQESLQLEGYQAILVGSAVHYGNWLPEAVEFVEANRQTLNRLPVALFTVHITNLGDDETSRRNRLAFLDKVRPLLDPVDEAFFAGKFDRRGAALLLPGWLAHLVPTMDLRKWKEIRLWAGGIHSQLLPQV
jgi:menaquinone-dependent protoporphyrinogen oxidase